MEEVPDEDDISILSCHSFVSKASVNNDDPMAELWAEMDYGKLREAPTVTAALTALKDLKELLRPHRTTGRGYKDPGTDPFVRVRMENMEIMLNLYTGNLSKTKGCWAASSLQAAVSWGRGTYCARQLRILVQQFIVDRDILPLNPCGYWNMSMLVDEDLKTDINLFLQELGKDITAEKLVEYLRRGDVMAKHDISRKISLRTAQRYLKELGYRYMTAKKRPFLPAWAKIQGHMDAWSKDNLPEFGPRPNAPAKPYAKGEGASLMVADFVSSKYGWMRSPDGKHNVRVVMRPGENKDGYFTNVEIRQQAQDMMDLLNKFYPEHIFVYDNATTHLKRPEGSLSATKMSKGPSSNFLIEANLHDENGAQVYSSMGHYVKHKIQMEDATFNGEPQPLYFPDDHPLAGQFKGMVTILSEWGINTTGKLASCTGFKCPPSCPDFEFVKSSLQIDCEEREFGLLFLPKFHCELNFVEQCWGYAKRLYQDALEHNALAALDAVPLASMRWSMKFMDAYSKGLTGTHAVWAAHKYSGHRVVPDSLMDDMEAAGLV
ncbi:hypothetical protein C8R43DRAFT_1086346 [Mycena crocata]|nr:hypothetical protein C8R43DRAFT_1086346 [Mycena crocata]